MKAVRGSREFVERKLRLRAHRRDALTSWGRQVRKTELCKWEGGATLRPESALSPPSSLHQTLQAQQHRYQEDQDAQHTPCDDPDRLSGITAATRRGDGRGERNYCRRTPGYFDGRCGERGRRGRERRQRDQRPWRRRERRGSEWERRGSERARCGLNGPRRDSGLSRHGSRRQAGRGGRLWRESRRRDRRDRNRHGYERGRHGWNGGVGLRRDYRGRRGAGRGIPAHRRKRRQCAICSFHPGLRYASKRS
jgi:hypothetical protein